MLLILSDGFAAIRNELGMEEQVWPLKKSMDCLDVNMITNLQRLPFGILILHAILPLEHYRFKKP